MKNIRLTLAIIFGLTYQLEAQSSLNIGGGYYGENITSPGLVVEFEYEKFFTDELSLPLRVDLIFYVAPEYNNLLLDIHKWFRKFFASRLFIELSFGIVLV